MTSRKIAVAAGILLAAMTVPAAAYDKGNDHPLWDVYEDCLALSAFEFDDGTTDPRIVAEVIFDRCKYYLDFVLKDNILADWTPETRHMLTPEMFEETFAKMRPGNLEHTLRKLMWARRVSKQNALGVGYAIKLRKEMFQKSLRKAQQEGFKVESVFNK